MKHIAKSYTEFDFVACDFIVALAVKNKLKVRLNAIIPGSIANTP